ncbi:eukaryotic translation initiation factor 4E binding protein 2 [Cricetulus griseus]
MAADYPGTRIIYDRKFLLDRRNSPMAQTPPCHLPNIPGVTSPGTLIEDSKVEVNNLNNLNNHDRKHAVGEGLGSGVTLGWTVSLLQPGKSCFINAQLIAVVSLFPLLLNIY